MRSRVPAAAIAHRVPRRPADDDRSTSTTRRTSPITARCRPATGRCGCARTNCRSSTGSGTTRDPKAIFQVDPLPRDPRALGVSAGLRASDAWRPAFRSRWCRSRSISRRRKQIRLIYDEQPLARLRAGRPRAGELHPGRAAGARRASGRRGSIRCDRRTDAACLQERNDFDLRSEVIPTEAEPPDGMCTPVGITSCRTPSGASRAA